jgi:hypothetical protein
MVTDDVTGVPDMLSRADTRPHSPVKGLLSLASVTILLEYALVRTSPKMTLKQTEYELP